MYIHPYTNGEHINIHFSHCPLIRLWEQSSTGAALDAEVRQTVTYIHISVV